MRKKDEPAAAPLELALKEGEQICIKMPFIAGKSKESKGEEKKPSPLMKPPSVEDWSGFQSFSAPPSWAKFE